MKYTLRLDYDDNISEFREKIIKFFTTYDDKFLTYLIYQEHGTDTGKVHAQGIIDFECKDNVIRNLLTRFFNISGTRYSMAKMKSENYEIYITKEKDRIISKGYTDDMIKTLEDASYLPELKSTVNIKRKKVKTNSELYLEFMNNSLLETELAQLSEQKIFRDDQRRRKKLELIVRYTTNFFSKSLGKPFARQNIENYVRMYLCRNEPEYLEKFVQNLTKNMFEEFDQNYFLNI